MTNSSNDDKLGRFQALLDAFGADPARWPTSRRSEAEAILAAYPAARSALREAQALDQVLSAAPLVPRDRANVLADRILAAAVASAQVPARPTAIVVPMRRPRGVIAPTTEPTNARPRWQLGGIAAALAASLVMGVFLGTADIYADPFRSLASMVRTDDNEQLASVLPGDDLSTVLDEDQL